MLLGLELELGGALPRRRGLPEDSWMPSTRLLLLSDIDDGHFCLGFCSLGGCSATSIRLIIPAFRCTRFLRRTEVDRLLCGDALAERGDTGRPSAAIVSISNALTHSAVLMQAESIKVSHSVTIEIVFCDGWMTRPAKTLDGETISCKPSNCSSSCLKLPEYQTSNGLSSADGAAGAASSAILLGRIQRGKTAIPFGSRPGFF
jgi:hypothetical protein